MLLEIGVDLAGGDRRRSVALTRPGADLWFAGREVGDQAARLPDRSGDPAQARFVDAVARPHLRLLGGVELTELSLEPRRERERRRPFTRGHLLHLGPRLAPARQ